MFSARTALPAVLALGTLAAPAVQERVKKKGPEDFPGLIAQADAAWKAETFGACNDALKKAIGLVGAKRREAILAAFPAAPEGWKLQADKYDENAAAMMMGITGTVVEASYRGPDGARLSLQAMVDSPMVQMVSMMIANPAMLGEDAELIKYGDTKAVLEKNGRDRYKLTIVVGGDVIAAEGNGMSDDALLAMMSQKVVDDLSAAMAR